MDSQKAFHLLTKTISGVGTFGELTHNSELVCVTVERDWQNNEPSISCIPAGVYDLLPHKSPRFGHCLAVENRAVGVTVYGPSQRTHCLFHAANVPGELQGCIAPGLSWMPTKWGVSGSRAALKTLMDLIGNQPAQLTIRRL